MRVTRHPYEIAGWGVGELWIGDGTVVVAHDPPTPGVSLVGAVPRTTPKGASGAPAQTLSRKSSRKTDGFVPDLLGRLQAYFAGERVSFEDVPLDEDWTTPFQAALAAALRAVPWGEIVSYGELSALAGRARAARAAGTFCAENRFSLFVPCHRVVSVGGIGGYGSLGVEYKQRLLALEGTRFDGAL
jgi:methylated-DNA-[protein]-cysteine S-methyltransferase